MMNAGSEKKESKTPTGQESIKKNIGKSDLDAMTNVGSEKKDTQAPESIKKNDVAQSLSGGELDTLRSILFGAQAQATDDRLGGLEAQLIKTSNELSNSISSLANRISEQMTEMQADFRKRDDDLRQQLLALIKSLDEQKTSREDLGDMLISMGNELQKAKKSNLIDSGNEENR